MRLRTLARFSVAFCAAVVAPLAVRGQSATIAVAQERIIHGTAKPSAKVEPITRRVLTTTNCGTARVCTPAWDLRVLQLRLDDSTVALSGSLAARFTVENRGRLTSEVSEARLCVASGDQCVGDQVEMPIPALQAGERLEVVQPVPSYSGRDVAPPFSLLLRVDPDRATGESNRSNNDASARVVIDTAALVIESIDVPAILRGDATQVPVTLLVHNLSRASAGTVMQVQMGGSCGNGAMTWGDRATRVRVPVLAADQSWSATVTVRHPNALWKQYGDSGCAMTAQLITADQQAPPRGSSSLTRPYTIKADR